MMNSYEDSDLHFNSSEPEMQSNDTEEDVDLSSQVFGISSDENHSLEKIEENEHINPKDNNSEIDNETFEEVEKLQNGIGWQSMSIQPSGESKLDAEDRGRDGDHTMESILKSSTKTLNEVSSHEFDNQITDSSPIVSSHIDNSSNSSTTIEITASNTIQPIVIATTKDDKNCIHDKNSRRDSTLFDDFKDLQRSNQSHSPSMDLTVIKSVCNIATTPQVNTSCKESTLTDSILLSNSSPIKSPSLTSDITMDTTRNSIKTLLNIDSSTETSNLNNNPSTTDIPSNSSIQSDDNISIPIIEEVNIVNNTSNTITLNTASEDNLLSESTSVDNGSKSADITSDFDLELPLEHNTLSITAPPIEETSEIPRDVVSIIVSNAEDQIKVDKPHIKNNDMNIASNISNTPPTNTNNALELPISISSPNCRLSPFASPSWKPLKSDVESNKPTKPTTRVLPIPLNVCSPNVNSRNSENDSLRCNEVTQILSNTEDSGVFSPSIGIRTSTPGADCSLSNLASAFPENALTDEFSSNIKVMLIKTLSTSEIDQSKSRKQFDKSLIANLLNLLNEDNYSASLEWISVGSNLEIGVFRFNLNFKGSHKEVGEKDTHFVNTSTACKNEDINCKEFVQYSENHKFSENQCEVNARSKNRNAEYDYVSDNKEKIKDCTATSQKQGIEMNSDSPIKPEKVNTRKNSLEIEKSKKIIDLKKNYSKNFIKSKQKILKSHVKEITFDDESTIDFTSGIPLSRENFVIPIGNDINSNTSTNVFKWKDDCDIFNTASVTKQEKILRNNNSILNTPSLNRNLTKKASKRLRKCQRKMHQMAMKKLYDSNKSNFNQVAINPEEKLCEIPDIGDCGYIHMKEVFTK